ncbi:response regulator transcription factor [Paenibacillus arenilitoris]|uniref:Helix-turn-helix domain-containing protein n=1 Tax=Paenibacillus arenilitoris TaxID=2772299 RepID=A0A927H988_9BACL|nr:helix-turn-helix domain-containing protein [Paenibacillus arenilitoris]MBD2871369.1 helix-turn-helix domain-containing protein [Paenibacillus arenilitoris]
MNKDLTVLIAEDEFLVRIGMKVSISNSCLPFTIVADASDGDSALDLYLEHRPDIVFTDIRMPRMDGIELIRKIREQDDECEIVVISCLEDFETLKNAAKYNIFSYLLKATMTDSEMKSTLSKLQQKYLGSGKKLEKGDTNSPNNFESLLQKYAIGKEIDFKSFMTLKSKLGNTEDYAILLEVILPVEGKLERLIPTIMEMFKERLDGIVCCRTESRLICLYKKSSSLHEDIKSVWKLIEKTCSTRFGIMVKTFDDLSELPELIDLFGQTIHRQPELFECIYFDDLKYEHSRRNQIFRSEIKSIINYLENNSSQDITLNAAAAMVGLSTNYFSNLFSQETGISFIMYLNHLRLERAKSKLESTDLPISEIAAICGFNDEAYFSRMFRDKIGVSPSKWRKMLFRTEKKG